MVKPTPQAFIAEHRLLETDPARYIASKSEDIARNPKDPHAYFGRHQGWLKKGDIDRALADIDTAISLEAKPIRYLCRGRILLRLGR